MKKRRIYLDYASATPIHAAVQRAILKAMRIFPGNPSATHEEGRTAKAAVESARQTIARSLSVKPEELLFTSGGTESNNMAIRGVVEGLRRRGLTYQDLHVVSTSIEHSSVLETLHMLQREGVAVTLVDPEPSGMVSVEHIIAAIRPNTALLTVSHVNSEIGTVQPITAIGVALMKLGQKSSSLSRAAPETRFPVLHVDAAQSSLYLDAGPHTLRADVVSYDAQKILGPKGLGVLFRDFSVPLAPITGGGSQERGIRPGTENVAGIVGTAIAFQLAKDGRAARAKKVAALRDELIQRVVKALPNASLTGSAKRRIANNAHFTIPGVDGDYLTILMDTEGIAVSPRSACSGSGGAWSHVVHALTHDDALARNTIRFSLGPTTTKKDIENAVSALVRSVHRMRLQS